MGLDPRSSQTDIAFILCDENIPDDVTWPEADRDKTGVWLDFIDPQFDCEAQEPYDSCKNIHRETVKPSKNTISIMPRRNIV